MPGPGPAASAGRASKFLVALLGVFSSGVSAYAGGAPWASLALAAATAAVVYLVPNSPPPAPPPAAPRPPASP